MANSEIIEEEITASSVSTKALRASPGANHHQKAASSSATNNENDLRDVNLDWKKYTAHMNAKIYVAGKEFKRLRNLGCIEEGFDELHNAIKNLELEVQKLQMIGSEPDLLDSAFAEVQKFMISTREKINQALAKSKDKCSIRSLVLNFKAKQVENPHQNEASSSEKITNDLRRLNSAWKKYTDDINAKISKASKEFKKLRRKYPDHMNAQINMASEEFKKTGFEKLQKDIENLKSQVKEWQIPLTSNEDDHDGGALSQLIGCELNLLVSAFDEEQKFKEADFDKFQKAIVNLKSQVKEMQIPLTSNEDDHDGGGLSQLIGSELDLLASAFDEVRKFKETDFDKFQKVIENLKSQVKQLQIRLISNEDGHDGGALSQMFGSDLDLLVSAFEGQKFMESTAAEDNQARVKSNELQKANFEKQQKGESSKLRKDIGKLRALLRSYFEIRSTDSDQHHSEWPDINGVGEGRMHFFFKENELNTDGVKFNEPIEHELCLLCFFKFPPDAFIRRTTMIYLWIGQGYILDHLQKKYPLVEKEDLLSLEEDAGKKIFDELITKRFIERCSLEPNSCKMSPYARSSLYKVAEDKGFTSNGTRDLDPESVLGKPIGHSCLINVGEAIINCKPETFEKMEHIRSLYLGRWQTSAKHHIELADTKILHGMSKLNNLTFLSLRGISLVTELPKFISKLNDLKILDLRACHNLERIPDDISSLKKLTHLDMSECYFLEHMPKSLAQLSKLEVLKGFFIGDSKNNKQSCTLSNLSRLSKLRKLNIYTSAEKFPTRLDLNALKEFEGLLKLTISWGGCSLTKKTGDTTASASQEEGEETLHLRLQKLDLQGFPMMSLPSWLCPSNLKELRKLYIRGGNLRDLGQLRENQGEHWNVEILRLKHLDALEIDWSKMMILFPKLIYMQKKKCSKLNFQGDERSVWSEWKGKESSVWMHKKAIDTRLWLQQKFFRSDVNSINLSSLLGYNQNIAQHNSTHPVD
ncbi:hypothetical protein Vadar_009939 [Vaccinium darrowii]|uniref:Uncharacterized protein n=1 Tax=Vaccinium darrowii TaxID=229202 RepID=A0ACB7YMK6_9ERIC|nr:hypothetical protein Vadar_009939 [Vaccinium darrowii]